MSIEETLSIQERLDRLPDKISSLRKEAESQFPDLVQPHLEGNIVAAWTTGVNMGYWSIQSVKLLLTRFNEITGYGTEIEQDEKGEWYIKRFIKK